jgi:hypothetical protein
MALAGEPGRQTPRQWRMAARHDQHPGPVADAPNLQEMLGDQMAVQRCQGPRPQPRRHTFDRFSQDRDAHRRPGAGPSWISRMATAERRLEPALARSAPGASTFLSLNKAQPSPGSLAARGVSQHRKSCAVWFAIAPGLKPLSRLARAELLATPAESTRTTMLRPVRLYDAAILPSQGCRKFMIKVQNR